MSKVTSKFQVTVPKAIAEKYGLRPGDEIAWVPAGDAIRVIPGALLDNQPDRAAQVHSFDQATERQRRRNRQHAAAPGANRGWTREDLYGRGRSG